MKRFFSFFSLLCFGCIFVQFGNGQEASFSVMARRPAVQEPPPESVSPGVINARPAAEPPTPAAPPAAALVKPPAAAESTAKPPAPVEPPAGIGVAEPENPPPPARREPLGLPVNPVPETPSRIAAQVEPKQAERSLSRTIWALVGQVVEIPFQGNGWVYLGEQENRQGIAYQSRRDENAGQKYLFQTKTAGTYTLKFYRQDFIENFIINEYIQVIVSENPGVAGTNRPQSVEQDQAGTAAAPTAATSAATTPAPAAQTQTPAAVPAAAPSRIDYLQQAKEAYTAGQFPQTIVLLDQFREAYPAGTDEAWWLYGQALEANSPNRDIRLALSYYYRLIREYPQSLRGTEAQHRIAYLERYYFNIR